MHSNGSFLYTVIEKARFLLEEPSADTILDDFIARQVIPDAYEEVLNAVRLSQENPWLMRFTFSTVADTRYYPIPPGVEQVVQLVSLDDDSGDPATDWRPRHNLHPYGPGWRLEGNLIVFEPVPTEVEDWTLLFIPSGDVMLHYGSGTVVGSARTTIQLAAAPTLGLLDQRPNAYVGQVLRVLHSGCPWGEQVIESYDVATRQATVRLPFASTGYPAAGNAITYEIAPLGWRSLWTSVAHRATITVGTMRSKSEHQMNLYHALYNMSLKTVRDKLGNYLGRVCKSREIRTIDNDDFVNPIEGWRNGV